MRKSVIIGNDAQAVNFREIRMGNIAPNTLYRSSHPIKDLKQEKTISLLASSARIAAVLNLSDTMPEIRSKAIFAPWYDRILKNGRVIALGMTFTNNSVSFGKKLKKGLQFINSTGGPWLIHCHAGIDRTGFVAIVLEALMGAPLDAIVDDYLQSFNSGYESSIHDKTHQSDSMIVMQILSIMGNTQNITGENVQQIAETYLHNTIGLSAGEVELLKMKLAGAGVIVTPCAPV